MQCPLCSRDGDKKYFSNHHLSPKCRDGIVTLPICNSCHSSIHAFFSNKQLEKEYDSVDALLTDDKFSNHVKWSAKQDISKRFTSKRSNNQKNRGRNG